MQALDPQTKTPAQGRGLQIDETINRESGSTLLALAAREADARQPQAQQAERRRVRDAARHVAIAHEPDARRVALAAELRRAEVEVEGPRLTGTHRIGRLRPIGAVREV